MRSLKPAVERQASQIMRAINSTLLFGEQIPRFSTLTARERSLRAKQQAAQMKKVINRTLLFGEQRPRLRAKQPETFVRLAHYWKW